MEIGEIEKQLGMSYDELVSYLLDKYGPAEYDYFVNSSCKTKNKKVTRTKEGLVCHHIDEDKAIMLSTPGFAQHNPFEYQKADRLVYCNVLEHLILHIKITEEPQNKNANKNEVQGIGGAVSFMCPQLNDCYNGYEFKREYEKNMYNPVADSFDGYIKILKYFLGIVITRPELILLINSKQLSKGTDGQIVERVYNAL